jgi:hypothetical protein
VTYKLSDRKFPEYVPAIIFSSTGALHHIPRIAGRDNTLSDKKVAGAHPQLNNASFAGIMGDCSNVWGKVKGDLFGNVSRLTGDISGILGNCSNIRGNVTNLKGFVDALRGDVTNLIGDCSYIIGDCSGVWGHCDDFTGDVTGVRAELTAVASLNPHKWAHET